MLAAYLLQDVPPLDTWRSRKALNAKNPRYPWYLGSTSFMCFDSPSSGVSQYKQAFSTDDGNLLVRRKPCACSACIDMEWENCALKVKLVFSQIFCDLTVPLCRTMSTSLLLCSWWRKAARRRFKLFVFVFFTSLISSGECRCRCQWRQSGTYVWNGVHTMVQGLLVAWWFSGEYEECTPSIVDQNHGFISNDRCDKVSTKEVSGPVLKYTRGPCEGSIQLQVCLW